MSSRTLRPKEVAKIVHVYTAALLPWCACTCMCPKCCFKVQKCLQISMLFLWNNTVQISHILCSLFCQLQVPSSGLLGLAPVNKGFGEMLVKFLIYASYSTSLRSFCTGYMHQGVDVKGSCLLLYPVATRTFRHWTTLEIAFYSVFSLNIQHQGNIHLSIWWVDTKVCYLPLDWISLKTLLLSPWIVNTDSIHYSEKIPLMQHSSKGNKLLMTAADCAIHVTKRMNSLISISDW